MKNALGGVQSVLLLGGRSEIGLAICRRLVTDGARRVVLAVRPGKGDGSSLRADGASSPRVGGASSPGVAELERFGATVTTMPFDVTEPGTHAAAIADAFEELGDVDVVVDAVGVLGITGEYEADPVAAADSAVTNFAGHVCADLVVADRLRAQGHGTLVVLSSAAGVRVRKANYVYGAAKAGLDGFASGLADALAGSGARVMVVRPGFVRTRMTAGLAAPPFAISPEAVAGAVADGLRLNREVVWVPAMLGPAFALARLVPRALWRRLPF